MKTKLLISGIAIVGIALFSCNKQEAIQPQTQNDKLIAMSSTTPMEWGCNWMYIGRLTACIHFQYDCFDEIIITPSHFSQLQLAINGGPSAIATFFSDKANYDGILPASPVADSLAAQLATGNYNMAIYSMSSANKKIFIGTSKATADSSNYSSVMQVTVQ